jgi:prepilin-type N-terminal cleavage/methylation domain-containing protein
MRRGFTVVELTIGMAITAVLLTGLFAALQSSVDAYAKSSADGVNRLTSRLLVERIALLVRTGSNFGPLPSSALDNEVLSTHWARCNHYMGQRAGDFGNGC